jgi:hypothetical protein
MVGYNGNASTRFIQCFDSATVPADGTAPSFGITFPVGTDQPSYWIPPGGPIHFSNGIVCVNSSTLATKTIGSADSTLTILYQ